ncbi:MAG: DsbA family protein [Oceanicaulis sp.]
MTLKRITAVAVAALGAVALVACGNGSADSGRTQYEAEGDRAKGSTDAPVTMIEYASVACGGCAQWHALAMPTVDEYIESGDVRYVFREMLTGQPQLAIAGFMLARCAPEDRYFDVIDVLFEQQRAIFTAMQQGQAQTQFQQIARTLGFSNEEFRQCMSDRDILAEVQAANEAATEAGVGSTPTFFFNGVRIEPVPNPDGSGQAYGANGEALVDDQGPIPATFEGETFERIILYFKNRAEE